MAGTLSPFGIGKLPSGVQAAGAVGVGPLVPGGSTTTVPGPLLRFGCADHVQKGRPFRVSNASRSRRKGIVASSLQELISKTLDAFLISAGIVTLVLEEDGTVVDTEEFFKSLDDNTHFMVLEEGQKWTQTKNGLATLRQKKKMGVANITFDLYKLHPKDFIGCLNIKATFYEIYSVSYDIKCMGAKSVLRKVLQLISHAAQITGQFLLYTGTYMLQLMGEYDEDGTCARSRRE
ncbi:lipid transferase CIDEA isoform 1-T1 [Ara ararauna]